jgi:GntR family transcriptional regulator
MPNMKKISLQRTGIPLYVQLEQIIKSKIMTGELLPGERIPTEKELAQAYQVSSITARQAVLDLVQEGLLSRKQGKGTFVQEGTTKVKNIMTLNVQGGHDDVVPEGLTKQKVEVLNMQLAMGPKRVIQALELKEPQEVMQIRRRRIDNGVVVSYVKNYLPAEIGSHISKDDLLSETMLQILRGKIGLPLERGLQYIEAIIADYEIATALSIAIASPVLYLETIIFAQGDRPVDFVQTFYRSDQFKYTLNINLDGIKVM